MRKFFERNRKVCFFIILVTCFLMAVMTVVNYKLNRKLNESTSLTADGEEYKYHVAMIGSDTSDVFWNSVYEGAESAGKELDTYIENFGAGLSEDYSDMELVEMAIAAKVDGIIAEAGNEEELSRLIDKANDVDGKEIPVITVLSDAPGSSRKSFVSANDYALGELYGNQVVGAARNIQGDDKIKTTVLVNSNDENSSPNLIYSGISESLAGMSDRIELSAMPINNEGEFESEEKVRKLFLDEQDRPDIIVCLSVTDTISAYQCTIDYNLVGKIQIIGYYTSPEILEGIEKEIIRSTIAINAEEMGRLAAEGMHEYLEEEYVSEYLPVSSELITAENISEYRGKDEAEE